MRLNSQRGFTLVELLVASTVTMVVLVGLGSVVFAANQRYGDWMQRVLGAAGGDRLGIALQADSHRLVPCDSGQGRVLALCSPGERSPIVTYRSRDAGGIDVEREEGGTVQVIVHGLAQAPTFRYAVECSPSVRWGVLTVTGLRYPAETAARPDVIVSYRAPRGGQC